MKRIALTNGGFAKVDDEDFEVLNHWKWRNHSGYACRNAHAFMRNGKQVNKTVRMHRQITNAPAGRQVDHINHDTLDNRRSNLRVCTAGENRRNCGPRRNNKTGYKGVSWRPDLGSYVATIRHDRKQRYLSQFKTPEAAALRYNEVARDLHGEFAYQNRVASEDASPRSSL